MSAFFGRIAVKGVGGEVTHAALTSTSTSVNNSLSADKKAEMTDFKDANNKTIGFAVDDPQDEIQIDITPCGKTGTDNTAANAATAVEDWLSLDLGSVVTLAGHAVDWLNSDWNVIAIGARFTKNGFVTVPLTLRRYDGDALAAAT